jgi:hypothetical protein
MTPAGLAADCRGRTADGNAGCARSVVTLSTDSSRVTAGVPPRPWNHRAFVEGFVRIGIGCRSGGDSGNSSVALAEDDKMTDVISTVLRRFLRPRPVWGRLVRGIS